MKAVELVMKEYAWILWIAVAIGLIITGLYATRSKVLLYEFVEEDSVSGLPLWALLHPLRDRSPERSAEKILQILQKGDIEEALSRFPWLTAGRESYIMTREVYHPVQGWKLISRTDTPGTVELYYSVTRRSKRASKDLFSSPVWITLERLESDANWRAVEFKAYY